MMMIVGDDFGWLLVFTSGGVMVGGAVVLFYLLFTRWMQWICVRQIFYRKQIHSSQDGWKEGWMDNEWTEEFVSRQKEYIVMYVYVFEKRNCFKFISGILNVHIHTNILRVRPEDTILLIWIEQKIHYILALCQLSTTGHLIRDSLSLSLSLYVCFLLLNN